MRIRELSCEKCLKVNIFWFIPEIVPANVNLSFFGGFEVFMSNYTRPFNRE